MSCHDDATGSAQYLTFAATGNNTLSVLNCADAWV